MPSQRDQAVASVERAWAAPKATQTARGMTARFMLLVVGLVAAAAFMMAPGHDEQLAMLADENQISELIAAAERKLEDNPQNADLIATLSRAHEARRDYRQAAFYLERYVDLVPNETAALAKLAELYEKSKDEPRRILSLERLFAITPNLPAAVALSDAYNENGRADSARTFSIQSTAVLANSGANSTAAIADPLLAARLAFNSRDPRTARLLLDRVSVDKLDASDQLIWFDLLKELAPPPLVVQTLEAERRKGALFQDVLLQYALFAGTYGQDNETRAALAASSRARR